jgi:energy-coupling factor transporter ATP-binding protein EcfA2
MLLQKRIHDWSKALPSWQCDLLRRLAVGPLTDADRAEVRAILTGTAGAPAPVPLQLEDLPVDEDEHGRVELRRIGDFRNINCLAENQTLHLHPGLNLVFGPNGSGKTGHGRLLRGVCRAAEREQVLPNVFEPTKAGQSQTATIGITVDGVEQLIGVDLVQQPDRVLSAISVFDASCARIFVSRPNVIDYVPRSLVILKTLAEEQDAIAESLRDGATKLRMSLPALPELADGTAAAAALVDLGPKTDLVALEQLAELSEAEAEELEQLETAAATIRADKSGELEKAARARAAGATAAAAAIHEAAGRVEAAVLARIAKTRQQLDAVATAERELVDKAFASSRFPAAGGEPWREMWSAIVRYVEAGGGTFPSAEAGALCPTCEQELTPEAATRLANAQRFVTSELRQRAGALDVELQKLLAAIPDREALNTRLTSELRDAPEEVVAAGAAAVSAIASLSDRARALTGREQVDEDHLPVVDVALIEAYAASQNNAADAQAALRDTDKQQEVLHRLGELQARRTLHEHLPAVKQRIETLNQIAVLDTATGKLGTQSISLQLRKLQEAEITERLRTAIQEELKHTTVSAKVEVVGQASKGETRIQLRLAKGCKHKVDTVLSTGEQAALGTAFFLAELAVSAGESAIVLEDPVSSLDHDHREYLARRLVEEAKKRQVVIYTHDLSFLIYLQDAAVQEGVELHGHTLESSLDEAGIVREGLPTKLMSPADRRKELRRRLKYELAPLFKGKEPDYEPGADLWVADLRKAYDQLIEDYVLAGTVRRYSPHVRVRHLFMITWTLEIASRIETAMKQASPKSHHEAPELYPRAYTPDELEAMLVEFEAICELTKPKKIKAGEGDVKQESEQTTIEDELVAKVASMPQAS